jgi:tetratricopeptide (TPR) repeat protein
LAGDAAAKSQAFDEAVRAYSDAYENFIGTNGDKQNLKQKLAFSLGRLGRASEAGDLYLELAHQSNNDFTFLQLAAYQFCVAGRIKDALQEFDRLLRPQGYKIFQSERSVLLRLAWLRLRLRLRDATTWIRNKFPHNQLETSHSLVANSEGSAIPANSSGVDTKTRDTSDRIKLCDLLWDAGIAFTFFDMMRAGLFILYSQAVATQEGDELRILRGNIMRANHEAMCGTSKEQLVKKLLAFTDNSVAARTPYLTALHLLSAGMSAHSLGHWKTAHQKCVQAEACFRKNCEETNDFEGTEIVHLNQMGIGAAQLFTVFGLQHMGQFKEVGIQYREYLSQPENREHLLNRSNLMIFVGPYVSLAEDRPAEAHELLEEAVKMWAEDKFCFQRLVAGYAHVEAYLYEGDLRSASQTVEELWNRARWSTHFLFELLRGLFIELRGRCAVQRIGTDKAAARLARRSIKKLENEKAAWTRPFAEKLRAGIELKNQNLQAAEVALIAARDGFRECNLQHYQFTAEAKLCEITGATDTERYQAVKDWFKSQEITNQDAFVRMHYPV